MERRQSRTSERCIENRQNRISKRTRKVRISEEIITLNMKREEKRDAEVIQTLTATK